MAKDKPKRRSAPAKVYNPKAAKPKSEGKDYSHRAAMERADAALREQNGPPRQAIRDLNAAGALATQVRRIREQDLALQRQLNPQAMGRYAGSDGREDLIRSLVGNSQGNYGTADVASPYAAEIRARYNLDLAQAEQAARDYQQGYRADPSFNAYKEIREGMSASRQRQIDRLTKGMPMADKRQVYAAEAYRQARDAGYGQVAANAQTRAGAYAGTAWAERQQDAQRQALAEGGLGIWSPDQQRDYIAEMFTQTVNALKPFLGEDAAKLLDKQVIGQVVDSIQTGNMLSQYQSGGGAPPSEFDATYGMDIPDITDPIDYERQLGLKQQYASDNSSNVDLSALGGDTGAGSTENITGTGYESRPSRFSATALGQ